MAEELPEGTRIPIASATKDELRKAAIHLGVSVTNFDDETKLRAKLLKAGWDGEYIFLPDTEAQKAAAGAKKKPPTAAASAAAANAGPKEVPEPMVEIEIQSQEGAGGKRPVFAAVNGKAILIPRGKRVAVKHRYYIALENAMETKWELNEENNENEPRDMHSYPFRVHKMPSEAEIERYRAWYAEQERPGLEQAYKAAEARRARAA